MPADLLAALTTAAGLARTANDTGQSLSRREHGRDRLHAWTDDHPWMFADVVERVRELDADNERLRVVVNGLSSGMIEPQAAECERLRAELVEAVGVLSTAVSEQREAHEMFDGCPYHADDRVRPNCWMCRAATFVAKHKGNAS